MKSTNNKNAKPENNAGGSIGKSEQNSRSHMSNKTGANKSVTGAVKNMAKETGGKPGKKDGLS